MTAQKGKTQKNSFRKEQLDRVLTGSKYSALSLCFIIGLVPLILFFRKVVRSDPGSMFSDGLSSHLDLFSYYKAVFLILFTIAGFLFFFYSRSKDTLNKSKKIYYIPLAVFASFALLSALLSEYKTVAFFGFIDRYEGAFVILSYLAITFLAMNVFREEKQIRLLMGFFIFSGLIISIIGFLQLMGFNYYDSKAFMNLVTPGSLKNRIGEIKSLFPPKTVFSTLINSNYVGSYMALLLPVNLVLLLSAKKISHKMLLSISLLLAAINWIGCESRAGIVGGVVALVVIGLLLRRKIFEKKWIALGVVFLLCTFVLALNFATGGSIVKKVERMVSSVGKDTNTDNTFVNQFRGISDIKLDSKKMSIVTDNGTILIGITGGLLVVQDESGNELKTASDGNIVKVEDSRFGKFKLSTNPDAGLIEVYYNEYKLINILFTEKGLQSSSNIWLTYRDNKKIETFGFSGMESYGSNRGYIWSRTLPLLKETLIFGHGPDTFPLYFPQYDYMGKLKMYQTGGIFVDKPHNIYLQAAVNTGVLSLIAMLALFGIYFVSSIKIYMKEEFNTFLPVIGMACFSAFCGYAAAGMFNDNVVAVAPVFWILLGLGIGINVGLKGIKQTRAG